MSSLEWTRSIVTTCNYCFFFFFFKFFEWIIFAPMCLIKDCVCADRTACRGWRAETLTRDTHSVWRLISFKTRARRNNVCALVWEHTEPYWAEKHPQEGTFLLSVHNRIPWSTGLWRAGPSLGAYNSSSSRLWILEAAEALAVFLLL